MCKKNGLEGTLVSACKILNLFQDVAINFSSQKCKLYGKIKHCDWHRLTETVFSMMFESWWWDRSKIADSKMSYLGCLTLVQQKWFKEHTSYLYAKYAKWLICFRMLWPTFPQRRWVEISPRVMRTKVQDPPQILCQ